MSAQGIRYGNLGLMLRYLEIPVMTRDFQMSSGLLALLGVGLVLLSLLVELDAWSLIDIIMLGHIITLWMGDLFTWLGLFDLFSKFEF